ncbi:YihY/virulence factor BrkB family protein [Flavobacterium sp. PL002]|uniref:YihY/virulence factor BrkB family protein n=1 Tax=Flavobacterium sp. PL002 TaxID=1897058 RepID=UPI00178857B1|nr:YihY/virulence factor BrkB family protein [Flavobacterium sp. PL002]MBE0393323.1 hypothetical protein [Flavobacterium sp. PL002]
MKFNIKHIFQLLKTTFTEWNDKDPFRQSAVIAYYAIFSIPGLLVLVISISGYFFGAASVNENIMGQISSTMGSETAKQVSQILSKSTEEKSTVWGSIIGVAVLLFGATAVFVELQKTLNLIWKVKLKTQKGFIHIIKARLFSFGLILAIAFLLTVSLVVSTLLSSMGTWLKVYTHDSTIFLYNIINFIFSLAIISALFALMFKILPDAKIRWKHVWLGAFVTGILFTIGKTLLAYYFSTAEPGSIYGVAGSIVLILLWVSYSSMILFFGAEFTAVYTRTYSGEIPPTDIAEQDPNCISRT